MADISKRIERAEKYVQKGRLDDALEEYLYAYKEDPANDSLVEIIAELYLKQGQQQRALECFGYLFDKRAENNDGPGAVLIFRKMLRLGLQDPARMLQCAKFQEKTKPTESREHYRQSAQLFLQAGERAKALEALRGLAGLDAANAEAHLRVAELAESLGEKEPAGHSFARAGELMRNSASASKPDTLAALERAYALLSGDLHVAELLASSLLESGQAARAVEILKPLVSQPGPERNRLLAQAHIETGDFEAAEDLLWRQSSFPEAQALLWTSIQKRLDAGDMQPALSSLRRMQQTMFAARKEEDFARVVEEYYDKYHALEILDFLAAVYTDLHKPSKVSDALSRLYEAYYEKGNITGAANALARHVDNDNSDPRHKERLERLKDKLDAGEYRSLSSRVLGTPLGEDGGGESEQAGGSLEEMMLQAEMLMQFGSPEAAVEYLKGVARQFPGEDARSERLRSLYQEAGLPVSAPAVTAAAAAAGGSGGMVMPECIAELSRVPEITRNIHRQGTVKAILSAAVNEVGKAWQASRCLVGLCAPGKGPTAAMEYCAPGIKSSDAPSIIRLITYTVQISGGGDPLAFVDAPQDPALAEVVPVLRVLGIQSLLVLPLMDAEQPVGVMLLQQCDRRRNWHPNEIYIGKTIVDQVVIAMSNVKLRSMMKAVSDERSGLLSRSAYIDCLLGEASRAQKHARPLAVALLRLGSGQQALDREFGDQARQKYMQDAGQALLAQLRENDIGVRYDPHTLALVLPDTASAHLPSVVARVRSSLATVQIANQPGLPITAAMGEAVLSGAIDPVDSVTELINRLETGLEAAVKEHASAKLLQAVR